MYQARLRRSNTNVTQACHNKIAPEPAFHPRQPLDLVEARRLESRKIGRELSKLGGSIYGATKWFVHGYAGNMSEEMREWGGRCTVIAPGMVDTPFFSEPKPDKIQPEDIARAVVFALDQSETSDLREMFIMPTG